MAAASSSVSVEAAPAPEPRAALRDVAGRDDGEVGAERADLPVDEIARAGADRHHGDHRRDADDDAEHGQEAAQGVAGDGRERGADRFGQPHATASIGRGASSAASASRRVGRLLALVLAHEAVLEAHDAAGVARDVGIVRDEDDA